MKEIVTIALKNDNLGEIEEMIESANSVKDLKDVLIRLLEMMNKKK